MNEFDELDVIIAAEDEDSEYAEEAEDELENQTSN